MNSQLVNPQWIICKSQYCFRYQMFNLYYFRFILLQPTHILLVRHAVSHLWQILYSRQDNLEGVHVILHLNFVNKFFSISIFWHWYQDGLVGLCLAPASNFSPLSVLCMFLHNIHRLFTRCVRTRNMFDAFYCSYFVLI